MSRATTLPYRPILAFPVFAGLACAILAVGCNSTATNLLGSGDSRSGQDAGALAPAASPVPNGSDATATLARDIEEADVVKQVDNKIYVLNSYKGLIVVDVANPDQPKVLGSLDLRGRGIEMYVVGSQAFIILDADFGYYYPVYLEGDVRGGAATDAAFVPPPQPEFTGSQVAIIDVSTPASLKVLGKINLVGYAEQSRRVGSVLYVAGQNLPSWQTGTGDGTALPPGDPSTYYNQDRGFIASINVADPANIQPVERETFRGGSLNIHVSTSAIFAASSQYDNNTGNSFTRVQYADITDPAGAITLRDSVDVPGDIRNHFYMDDFSGTFRICTDNTGFGFRSAKLFTYDIANPDDIKTLGNVEIIRGETLQAVRFDGNKAYAVTFLQVDPLFVINLTDPAHPAVTGQLEVPGYSTHIEPRGDRLIAVGIDNTAGQRPAVSYYNVADPAAPTELGRVILGPPNSYTDSQATYDEKAFKIIDSLGMIVIPFNHTEYDDTVPPWPTPLPGQPIPLAGGGSSNGFAADALPPGRSRVKCINGVQIVDFSDTALEQRGWFDARSRVSRVGQVGTRVFAISDVALETVNIDDRDHPAKAGEALFVPEADMAIYDGCGYYYNPYPVDFPVDVGNGQAAQALLDLLNQLISNGACGTVSALPGAMLAMGLMFMRNGKRRKF